LRASDDSGLELSVFYPLLEGYDPIMPPAHAQATFEDGIVALEAREQEAKENQDRYWHYLRWQAILENLKLNALCSDADLTKLEVHYRFLSSFVHPISHRAEHLYGRHARGVQYDHYSSELVLLYAVVLGCREIADFHRVTRNAPTVELGGWKLVEDQIGAAEKAAAHLWFIGQSPHPYDAFVSANQRAFAARKTGATSPSTTPPDQLREDEIGYYTDPLQRLVKMHCSVNEWLGFSYISPFHRSDAWLR
jgi:hypothetical protein